ncbi:MAG: hypothetical protein ABTQ31_16990 [Rhizobiaceae bacterium]
MSAPLQVSAALLNSRLVQRAPSLADGLAELEATIAFTGESPILGHKPRLPAGFGRYGERARQRRVYDRAKSRQRKREMGGDGRMPNTIRHWFTEGERAVLSVIADEVKKRGRCEMEVEKIASKAGVSIRLTQCAIATASWRSGDVMKLPEAERPPLLIVVEYRPRKGRKSLPNIIKIVSRAWISWLSYRPSEAPALEAAEDGEWTIFDAYAGKLSRVSGIGCRKKHTSQNPYTDRLEEEPKAAEIADGWQRLRHGLPLQGAFEREWAGPMRPSGNGGRG